MVTRFRPKTTRCAGVPVRRRDAPVRWRARAMSVRPIVLGRRGRAPFFRNGDVPRRRTARQLVASTGTGRCVPSRVLQLDTSVRSRVLRDQRGQGRRGGAAQAWRVARLRVSSASRRGATSPRSSRPPLFQRAALHDVATHAVLRPRTAMAAAASRARARSEQDSMSLDAIERGHASASILHHRARRTIPLRCDNRPRRSTSTSLL